MSRPLSRVVHPTRIVINGAKGRMGHALVACATGMTNLEVTAQTDLGDDVSAALDKADVVIDFSFHEATAPLAERCLERGKALVVGTTGHSPADQGRITACAARIPLVWSSNYSTGVNALFWLTRRAAEILGPGFDLEVVELHHRMKRDAPSGTAKTLAEILAETRGRPLEELIRPGRHGITGERTAAEIGVHSLRGGDVVGDHTVLFAGAGERLELTHKASSRETFARGALRAASWVTSQPPGLYTMQDVLGLK